MLSDITNLSFLPQKDSHLNILKSMLQARRSETALIIFLQKIYGVEYY
jgi:hypothetical protein